MLEDRYYTLQEVAKMAKLTDRTLRNYLVSGQLQGTKVGGQWRFTKDDIIRLFSNDDYYMYRKGSGENKIRKYINNELEFQSDSSACLIVDLKKYEKEAAKTLVTKLRALENDDDVKEKVTLVDDDNNMRIMVIASFEFVSKVIEIVNGGVEK